MGGDQTMQGGSVEHGVRQVKMNTHSSGNLSGAQSTLMMLSSPLHSQHTRRHHRLHTRRPTPRAITTTSRPSRHPATISMAATIFFTSMALSHTQTPLTLTLPRTPPGPEPSDQQLCHTHMGIVIPCRNGESCHCTERRPERDDDRAPEEGCRGLNGGGSG